MALSYKRNKPTDDFDCIIIGSGMSGLTLAAVLAKEGKKCLILERHYTPGGYTHVFKRRDYEWDVGIHYIGEVHRSYTVLHKAFNYITDGALKWEEMDENYDSIFFGKERFDFIAGKENFIEKLASYFPEEREALEKYVALLKEVNSTSRNFFAEKALPPLISKVMGGQMRKPTLAYSQKTTKEVLLSLTSNEKLIGVLTGQFGDYGLPPEQSSFFMHAILAKHYLNGGAFPIGGSAQIFDTIEPIIEAAGGEVYTNAEVAEILTKSGKAIGVKMEDGTEIKAKKVISSVGAHLTFEHLLKSEKKAEKMTENVQSIEASAAHLCLYIGLNANQETLKLPQTNYWIYPEGEYNHDTNIKRYLADPDKYSFPLIYISFPSAKDPTWAERYPGKSTVEIITLTNYEWFKKWDGTRWHKRGEDYDTYKENLSQKMLQYLYDYVPQVKDHIDVYELSSPLSTKHFVNYQKGEIYGLNHHPERFNNKKLRPHTPIKNLYLTGQDIVSCGIGGALMAGVLTASAMEKKDFVKKILS